ncbi:unnamed protein product [Larinioides sclopetarius]|uniref:Uncharacterized protein n=1 Tax=Larinioides sclopetarius TaxID=280406 RepID=A0AAV2BFL9_9ARAC
MLMRGAENYKPQHGAILFLWIHVTCVVLGRCVLVPLANLCFQSYWILSKLRLQDEKRRFQRHPEYYFKHTQDCFNAVTSQNVQDGS